MAKYDYDLFVIGAGSGGTRAARVSASYGAKVAVAEEYRVGGTCVIRGCVPKKLLVYGSHFSEELEDGKNFGWTWENARFDWARLRDHVLKDVDRLNNAYTDTLKNHGGEIILERTARDQAGWRQDRDRKTYTDRHGIMARRGRISGQRTYVDLERHVPSREAARNDHHLGRRLYCQ